MNDSSPHSDASEVQVGFSALLQSIRARTPARILVGRAGPGYRTATQLALRQDHAAALEGPPGHLQQLRLRRPQLLPGGREV